ncbi:MAG: lipopolysaccharide heptosyltransferase I [Deltaproteobacteria bacterium]
MMNILIVKTSAIGDVTHTLPALNALRHNFPDAHIAWMVEEAAAGIILGHPAIDRLLISRRKSWLRNLKRQKKKTLREILAFVKELRDTRYDLLLDFQGLLKSSMFIALCRADRKIGFGRGMEHAEMSYLFLNERVPPVSMEIHAVDRELGLLRAIGITTGNVDYALPLSPYDHQQADALLDELEMNPAHPLVVINPMTTWPTKYWHKRGFAEVADRLRLAGNQVVFTGGRDDAGAIAQIQAEMQQPVASVAGRVTLKTLAALFSRAAVVISTDTGPMHIAAAAGTPVVALFGPTAPWRTGPYGKGHLIIRTACACSPCYKKSCALGTTACMQDIAVEEVVAAAKTALTQPQ